MILQTSLIQCWRSPVCMPVERRIGGGQRLRERETETERQRQTDRQTDRQRNRERETDRQTDRQTDTQRNRERERERESSNSKTLFYKECSLGSVKTCPAISPC